MRQNIKCLFVLFLDLQLFIGSLMLGAHLLFLFRVHKLCSLTHRWWSGKAEKSADSLSKDPVL